MKKQTILKLAMTTICLITCLNTYAATMEDAKNWFNTKQNASGQGHVVYNAYQDKAVWYTLYSSRGDKYAFGCLPPNGFRFVKLDMDYKVLIEVKDRLDCGGGNICKTDSTHSALEGQYMVPQYIRANKNGNNCYISYHRFPSANNFNNADDQKMVFKADYQRDSYGVIEHSPIQVTVENAFYGIEGQPTWEINGKRITDIIKATQNDAASLYIPANMNQYFGKDPLVNQPKIVAVQILVDGKVINLRQKEGKELKYPGVEGTDYWIVK